MIGKHRILRNMQNKLSVIAILGLLLGMFAPLVPAGTAYAAQVTGYTLTGGTGTYTAPNGTIYAKTGGSLTLVITTDSDTKCVELTGDATDQQLSDNGKTSWSFALKATGTAGTQSMNVLATAYKQANPHGKCVANQNETLTTQTVSYVLDNAGPTVTPAVAPAPNAAGWNKADVAITWTATDAGSGVASGPTPTTDNVTANTAGETKTATATDRLGNTGNRSVTVKLDKDAPTITGSRSPEANGAGWNNTDVTVSFTTSDALSGVASPPAAKVLGEGANQSHTASVSDNAGNSASATVGDINVDKTTPTLSGAPTNANLGNNGWYTGDVTVAWNASDALSGVAANPANSTVKGEGNNLSASAEVTDKAGNTTAKTVTGIKIDRTAPGTDATAPSGWKNTAQTVTLTANDGLSGVAATHYILDNGQQQTGTSVAISGNGTHTLEYWSVDNAGNAEAHKTVEVKIDGTPPTIISSQSPAANATGWNKGDVTVSFACEDLQSGIASCTPNKVVSTQGKDQKVTGTATNNAGDSVSADHYVSIDTGAPTIKASADRAANAAGWYKGDVTVGFTCGDALSGVDTCPAAQTLGEGENQRASGTATDAAGNSSSDTVTGINVDKTNPTLTGTPSTTGWSRGDVTVTWTASDALSGLAGADPAPSTVKGEGNDLSASAEVTDKAGNSKATTFDGIKIDRTAPSTSAKVPAPLATGWYDGPVQVTLNTGADLSGVAKTYYSVDGGEAQVYDQDAKPSIGKGTHTVTFWSEDVAGNVEDKAATANTITLKVDGTPPTTTISLPAAFASGWYADSVPVAFGATDQESGVAKTYYIIDGGAEQVYAGGFILHNLAGAHTITFWSEDTAGNVEDRTKTANTVVVKVDASDPTITGSRSPAANDHGWNNETVTVSFECKDEQSGVAIENCTPPTPVENEGAGQSVKGTAKDNVGKTATMTIGNINIDKTKPVTAADVASPLATGWYAGPVTVTLNAGTDLSGIDKTYYTVNGGGQQTYTAPFEVSGKGSNTVAFWSVDKAGNIEDKTKAANTITLKIDGIKPTIKGSQSPAANGKGWNNKDVTVQFDCSDAESGMKSCTADGKAGETPGSVSKTLTEERASQVVQGYAEDVAGNTNDATVEVSIDKTKPTLSGAATEGPNAAGWYKGDVTIKWTGQDMLSGIDTATQPANSTVTGEGSNRGAGPETVKDNAGNESAPASVDGIKIDRGAPTITPSKPAANAEGWYTDAVSVSFECTDPKLADGTNGSGVASCPSDVVVSGNGANQQSEKSADATDLAGNSAAGVTVGGINIDGTAPQTKPDNQCTATNGFCTGSSATVVLTAVDQTGLSGVREIHYSYISGSTTVTDKVVPGATATVTVPLDGSGQATVSFFAVDKAGNTEPAGNVTLQFDNIAPMVTHTVTPKANAAGWNNKDVTVHFDAKDNDGGSGVDRARTTLDQKVTAETPSTGLEVFGEAYDTAGNKGTDKVTIRLDKTAPKITASARTTDGAVYTAGTWTKQAVTVSFNCSDALSDIAVCPKPVTLTANGAGADGAGQSVSGEAQDVAGNTASATFGGIKIDQENPTIVGGRTPIANTKGWNNQDVIVSFNCADTLSDIESCVGGKTVSTEGAGQSVKGTATDNAGNTADATVSGISIDKTDPTISGAVLSGTKGVNGWYTSKVTVRFTCADPNAANGTAGSGIQDCPADVVLENGANQSASGTAKDNAGNTKSAMVSGINIDMLAPTINFAGIVNGGVYTLGTVPTASCTADDNLSGVNADGCKVSVTGGTTNGVGTFTYTATATDNAGNTATVTGSYKVTYKWDGFLQPINDTAHQVGTSTSIFKGGSTIPAKFQLKRADGTVVQAATAPKWLTPVKGSATSAAVDELAYSEPATSGGTYTWNSTGNHYQYNWSTKGVTAGFYYRIGVMLDDGQTYYVNIGLR